MIVLAMVMLGAAANAQEKPLDDPAQESRALDLFKELRCPTCIAQSIHDSNADIAVDLRSIVREQIAQGHSNAQIREFLVLRYGDVILLRPPVNPTTLPLWLGPWFIFIFGGIIFFFVLRKHSVKAD